jgi:hypothetical protein
MIFRGRLKRGDKIVSAAYKLKLMKLSAIASVALVAVGCAQSPAQTGTLEAGTPIRTILLRELTSGGSDEKDVFPLLVIEDVNDATGTILVPKGAIAYGKVVWSRGAGALSRLTDKPARLAIAVEKTTASDGQIVELKADQKNEEGRLELNGENTAREQASKALKDLLADPESRLTLDEIEKMFRKGATAEFRPNLGEIARKLGLSNTVALAQAGGLGAIPGLLQDIAGGRITHIAGAQAALLVGAINELADVGGQVGGWLAGRFKGSNIKAYAGTPITVYVAKTINIRK